MENLAVVILAAGQSTRMKSRTSKVLHPIAGRPLVSYSIFEASQLDPKRLILVIGDGQENSFRDTLGKDIPIEYCIQTQALGTGDAVSRAEKLLQDFDGYVLILPGDVPLISSKVISGFVDKVIDEGVDCGVVSTILPDPSSYGRIIRDKEGEFIAIREDKDATEDEKAINEINTAVIMARSDWLFGALKEIRPHNAQKELYLTDVIELAVRGGRKVLAHVVKSHEQFLGVNDRFDLAYASKIMYLSIAEQWMTNGVSIQDADQTYIDSNVKIGQDTTIAPFSFLRGDTQIGENCFVDTGVVLQDVHVGDNVHIKPHSVIEKSKIKDDAIVGPFSRIRPDSLIDKGARVGNFVEIKKSHLKPGVKANHLSYIGNATVGEGTNVGCGTITCNYDGFNKYNTVIGKDVLIGSDTQFVAPVKIGDRAVIGAGSTITKDVPPDALATSRTDQVNVDDWAKGYRERKKKK